MIRLISIDKTKLRYYVKLAFEGDTELLESLHVSPGTLDHCVDNTVDYIDKDEMHFGKSMEFYAVVLDVETVIGYTIVIRHKTGDNELYSFGIRKEYRTVENKRDWLCRIKTVAANLKVILWSKNRRAIGFFKKNNCIIEPIMSDINKTLIVMDGDA